MSIFLTDIVSYGTSNLDANQQFINTTQAIAQYSQLLQAIMSHDNAVQVALARNLLSSMLSFGVVKDVDSPLDAQLETLEQMCRQHNIFGVITDGKALSKFHTRLYELIDGDAKSCEAGYRLWKVVLEQSPLSSLEHQCSTLFPRITTAIKQLFDKQHYAAAARACEAARELVRCGSSVSSDVKRDLSEILNKLQPVLLSRLQSVAKDDAGGWKVSLQPAELDFWLQALSIFSVLLEAMPTTVRSYATKLENALAYAFYSTDSNVQNSDIPSNVLINLCRAASKPTEAWKQTADKTIASLHQQLNIFAGTQGDDQKGRPKPWVKDAELDRSDAPIYSRAQSSIIRFQTAASLLSNMMHSQAVSEREVQIFLPDIIAFTRRAFVMNVREIGKQTGVSDDGVRLPISIVYGVVPQIQQSGLQLLSSCIDRLGLCALRKASHIRRTLQLASENVTDESVVAFYDTITTCVQRMGASSIDRFGVSLLDDIVQSIKHTLNASVQAPQATNADKSGAQKGKKRKRQPDVAQLSLQHQSKATFMSKQLQSHVSKSVYAGLYALATCRSVYGCLLSTASRKAIEEVLFMCIQNEHVGRDATSIALLSDVVTADGNGVHGSNLLQAVQHWKQQSQRPAKSSDKSLMPLLSLSVGEALLHPRSMPMYIADPSDVSGVDVGMEDGYGGVIGSRKSTKSSSMKGVKGANDWDAAEQVQEAKDEVEAPEEEVVQEEVMEEEVVDDDDEDERPPVEKIDVEKKVTTVVQDQEPKTQTESVTAAVAKEEEDEFPDIVMDDADE